MWNLNFHLLANDFRQNLQFRSFFEWVAKCASSRSTLNSGRTRHRSICSPNGLTKTSIKRIQSIRDSRTEIGSILEHSTLQISRLDSDFEQSIFKVDEDESHHQGMTSFMDQSMVTIPDYDPAVKTYDCAICRRKFYHENSLDAHMVLHSTRDTLSRYGRDSPESYFWLSWASVIFWLSFYEEKIQKPRKVRAGDCLLHSPQRI